MKRHSEEKYIKEITDVIMRIAGGDLSAKINTSFEYDSLDAVAIGINMLGEELEEAARDKKKAEEEREKLLHDKGERVKELQCMYGEAESIRTRTTLVELFQDVVELIPPGWHYPEITRGKVIFNGKEYVSEPFEETEWKLSSDIIVYGECRGSIEVYYMEECPELDEGSFMKEERALINNIARSISESIEHKKAEKEINMYGQALKSTSEAVSITDIENKIVYVNDAFTNIYGYTSEEIIGKSIEIIRSAKNPPEVVKEILAKTIAGGWHGELLNRRKDGSEFPIFLSSSVVHDDKGKSIGLVGVAVDITEQAQARNEIINAKEAAEAVTRTKSEFLANMSHEIRTPMNGVIGMIGLLMDTELTNQQREYAETVKNSAESLLTVINDILDFSKIEAGKLGLEILDYDLRTTLEELNDMMAARAHMKGLELVCFIDPDG